MRPFTTNLSKDIVEENEDQIISSPNFLLLKGDILYAITKTINIRGKKIKAFLFLDERKRLESKEVFLKKIFNAEDRIKEGKIADRLTSDMLMKGTWKGKNFRRYCFPFCRKGLSRESDGCIH